MCVDVGVAETSSVLKTGFVMKLQGKMEACVSQTAGVSAALASVDVRFRAGSVSSRNCDVDTHVEWVSHARLVDAYEMTVHV
tara:strand:+ start:61 stop:306 length:246 start_codon:yes stop_codon:yes gene_type:complete